MSPEVFVLAPFGPEGRRVQEVVGRALEEAGFRVIQYSDAVGPGAELTLRIFDGIRRADLIVADVSQQNPNVLYEVGFAHALRKPTILLFNINFGYGLPSDLAGFEFIAYDLANLRDLAHRVTAKTQALMLQRSADHCARRSVLLSCHFGQS